MEPEDAVDEIRPLLDEYFDQQENEFDPDDPSVPLVASPYGQEEVSEALESMLSTWVTMGEKVERFEELWSDYVGAPQGVMTNSGSSANLLGMQSLSRDFSPDSEVVVPAVGWSTTYYPVIEAGATPVFVDVDPREFMIDIEAVKDAVNDSTEAVLPVHILGNPGPMDALTDLCKDHGIALIEDCAEAHGARFQGKHVGRFGDIGTFSFSFSHHITTGEGGMAVTNSGKHRRRMEELRSWGRRETDVDGPGPGFEFGSRGYNFRPTEIQAAFGIHQVDRMEKIVEQRRERASYLKDGLEELEIELMEEREGVRCSYLHHPMLLPEDSSFSAAELREHLEENGIESRPILSGNITRHPAFQNLGRVSGELDGADRIHEKGVYVSNHQYLTEDHMDHIVETVSSFVG